jgi:branched-chain amino acid transport system substrate-binding protein
MKIEQLCAAVAAVCLLVGSGPAFAEIKLGVIAGMSGPGTSYGIGIRQGAEMAAKEINEGGGIGGQKLELIVVDDASNPAQSVTAMQRLINEGVDLIVGGFGSSQVLANMEVSERAGIPYVVVGATNPRITSDNNKWTFRVIQTDSVMAQQLAVLATSTLKMKRIAVMNDSNDYGVGNRDIFVAALQKAGMGPVEVESYQSSDKDFTSQLARIRAAQPDGIAIFGTIPAAPAIMNQARDFGVTARFIGTGGLANEALISLAPKASAGTVLTTYFDEGVDAEGKAWAERYVKEFSGGSQVPRPVLAAWEYRSIKFIVAPCLAKDGVDKAKMRACIAGFKGKIFGLPGEASFDKAGQLEQQPVLVEVRNGSFRSFQVQ